MGSPTVKTRPLLTFAIAAAAIASCVAQPAAPATTNPPGQSTGTAAVGLPVDASIAQVSLSRPSANAAAALDACGIVYSLPGHEGKGIGADKVSGFGLVARGPDVGNYAAIGPAPQLQTDDAAWVVATSGWIATTLSDQANGIESKDPTCIVLESDLATGYWFSTGDVRQGTLLVTPLPFKQPSLRLPALAP